MAAESRDGELPRALLELVQWVTWRKERRQRTNGEIYWTKIPCNPRNGHKAITTNSQTWGTYQQAVDAVRRYHHDGIGFVVTTTDPFCGIDLDHCRDPETGEIEPWALAIVEQMQSYTEISPSGTGLRILIMGTLPPTDRKDGDIEMYDDKRFFTMTRRHLGSTPADIKTRQAELLALHQAVFATRIKQRTQREPHSASLPISPTRLDDTAILKSAQAAENGAKFARLWAGDCNLSPYNGDASRADMGLCNLLAFWTGPDASRIDRLFRQSGLMRPKWDEQRGESTYGTLTIAAVLATKTDYYSDPKVTPLRPSKERKERPKTQARPLAQQATDGSSALKPEPKSERDILLQADADDNGNAETMWRLFGHEFLFTPAIGWLFWTGTHWCEVPEPVVAQKAITTLKRRRHAAVEAGAEYIIKATKSDRARVAGCLTLFKSYVIEPDISAFDADPDLLNCANGVVNLHTGTLTPHAPSQRFTYCLSIPWTPDADKASWETFILDVLGGDKTTADYFQLCAGYSLTGHTREEKMFYLYGPTRAGKGTVTETFLQLMPRPLSSEVDFATFTAKRDNDSQNFDLANLKPARLIIASESNRGQSLNTAKVKQMTGGNLIYCAFKHRDMFHYRPQFKVWLVSNWEVKADPDDDAAWGRVQVFNFPHSHLGTEDTALKARMKSAENLRGVLRWAIEGAMRWYTLDRLVPPDTVTKATAEHRASQDYMSQWIGDCCVVNNSAWMPFAALNQSYTAWCKANNTTPRRPNDFVDALVKRFGCVYKRQPGTGVRGYQGIGLKEDSGVTPL